MLFLSLACGQNIDISAGNVNINELTNNIQVFVTNKPQCQFYPLYIQANVNDLVTFTFTNPNHYTSNLVMKVPDRNRRWFFIGSLSEGTNYSANRVFAINPGPAGIAFFQISTLNS
ncbi:MAG: hypothetical protein FE78DRAFT_87605, partial [Acidomyces sp. 'richmondensis']